MYNTYNHRYQKKEYELFDYFLFAGTKCLNLCMPVCCFNILSTLLLGSYMLPK